MIIPDNDGVGERHALQVAHSLLPVAKAVKIVRLPDLPQKGDISNWLDQGHTKDELAAIVKATAVLTAEEVVSASPSVTSDNPWSRAKSAPDFLAEEEKEFAGLAKDILAPGAVTLIAAPRGVGKSQTSHALAVALATGGVFRGEQVEAAKVLLLDRDNPESTTRKRLRSWGASQAHNLKVLTRQDAPDLRDKAAWSVFPVDSYDVLIVDSVGASTEGVTEKEGKLTTEILATILDLARKGIAILLLTNCTKDALSLKGRGEWADRADIIYEVRDATDFTPSGKKSWWMELPDGGEAAWADRAARRKGRIDFRLAFIASKFRLAAEPEPFAIELHLPKDETWTLRDVTAEILQAGENSLAQGQQAKEDQRQKAATALAVLVKERGTKGTPLNKTEAEEFLCQVQGLKRVEARQLLSEDNSLWRLENRRQGEGKQAAWCLLTKNDGDGDDTRNPLKTCSGEAPFVADHTESERRRRVTQESTTDKGSRDMGLVADSNNDRLNDSKNESFGKDVVVADRSESGRQRHVPVETTIHGVYSDTQFVAAEWREAENTHGDNSAVDDREVL